MYIEAVKGQECERTQRHLLAGTDTLHSMPIELVDFNIKSRYVNNGMRREKQTSSAEFTVPVVAPLYSGGDTKIKANVMELTIKINH